LTNSIGSNILITKKLTINRTIFKYVHETSSKAPESSQANVRW